MPRPHTPDEPLVVAPVLLADHWSVASVAAQRTADGRLHVRAGSGQPSLWLPRSLACLCAPHDRACRHQLVAALALDHPVEIAAGTPPEMLALPERQLHLLAMHLRHAARLPALTGAPLLSSPHDPEARSHLLTDPALARAPEMLIARLRRQGARGPQCALALPEGRRAGPVRDWLWAQAAALAVSPPPAGTEDHYDWLEDLDRLLGRLMPTASEGEAHALLATLALHPTPPVEALARLLDLPHGQLVATLPAPLVAHLLTTLPRRLRLRLTRALAERPRNGPGR